MWNLRASSVAIVLALGLVGVGGCTNRDTAKRQHAERGDRLFSQGKYDEAVLEYKNAIKLDTRYGDARFKLASTYLRTSQMNQALREFVLAADLMPERADVQIRAATLLLTARQYEPARKYAEAAVKAEPRNVDALIALANAMSGQQDVLGAIRELETAMEIAPGDSRTYSTLGAVKAEHGNRDAAETAYKRALEVDPKSSSAHLALAYFYWSNDRTADAEAVLKGAIAINQDDDLANRMLATLYLTTNRQSDAETPLLRLANKKDPAALATLGDLYARTNRADKARELYTQLLNARRTHARAVGRLATLDYAENKKERAYRQLDEALRTEPHNVELLGRKIDLLIRDGRLDDALDDAVAASASAPDSPAAKFLVGLVQSARGRIDEAIEAFNDAIRLDPKVAGADAQLARLLLQRGDAADALPHAQAARREQPRNREIRMTLAAILLATNRAADAETELRSLAAEFPTASDVQATLGEALFAKGDITGAAAAFDRAIELNPRNEQALTGRLIVDLGNKRPQDGRARIQKAIAEHPENAALLMIAARYEQTLGDMTASESFLRRTVEKDPSRVDAYAMLGKLYMRQQRLEEARQEFEKIVKRKPDSVPARTMIGVILAAQRKPEESKQVYEALLRSTSVAPVAANNLAYLYAERGERLDDALTLANEARSQLPDNPDVLDTLGWVYLKKNMADLAIKSLEISVRKQPGNPVFKYHLGIAYGKVGQLDRAKTLLEDALKLNPDFEGAAEARRALAAIRG